MAIAYREPKVSIVIPALNVAGYIRQCMDSVLGQTLEEIEVFVVDAASTDGTHEILEEYAAADPRVKLLDDTKKSTGYAKNLGIEMASAPYIAIVESDDYIEPDMMEKLYEIAEQTGADVVKAGFSTFLGKGDDRYDFPKSVAPASEDYGRIIEPRKDNRHFRWIMFEWLGLYRKSFLDQHCIRHNESPGAAFQDTGFWFLSFTYAASIYLTKEPFYHYRCDNPYASVRNPNKVFNICNEYDYIRSCLQNDKETWERVRLAYYRGFFYDNCVVYDRIADELRMPLLKTMRRILLEAQRAGCLDAGFYSEGEWQDLQLLLESEECFHDTHKTQDLKKTGQQKKLLDALKGFTHIVIFGAGSYGSNLQYFLESRGARADAYADNDDKKWGGMLNRLPVMSLGDCERALPDSIYLIANMRHGQAIREQLIKAGIDGKRIFVCKVEEIVTAMI